MGLDILAIRQAKLMDPQPDPNWADENYETVHHAWKDQYFAEQSDERESGFYTAQQDFRFRAGSYGGYNRWRENLSEWALHVSPEVVWKNADSYKGKPFFEIINFSDCEGVVGPKTSAKLAEDFRSFQQSASEHLDDWDYGIYCNFLKAFEMASDDGLVQFH